MTVGELIKMLQEYPEGLEVVLRDKNTRRLLEFGKVVDEEADSITIVGEYYGVHYT